MQANWISDDRAICGRPDLLLEQERRTRRHDFGVDLGIECSEQDFHENLRAEVRLIAIESNCVHHILRSKTISFIRMRTWCVSLRGRHASAQDCRRALSVPQWRRGHRQSGQIVCQAGAKPRSFCPGNEHIQRSLLWDRRLDPKSVSIRKAPNLAGHLLGTPSVIKRILMGLWQMEGSSIFGT